MKKTIIFFATAIFLSISTNANAFTFVKSVSMDFDESIIFDIVGYCIDRQNQDECLKRNMIAAKRLYKNLFRNYDTDFINIVKQCENKYFPDFQRIELCSM